MSVLRALHLSNRPAAGFVAMGLLWGSFAALVPVLKDQIGADDALFGLLLLGSPLGLFSTFWLAPLFDRALGARALPVSALLIAAAYLLPGPATTPAVFFVAMVLLGLGSGLLDIVSNARVSEMEARHNAPLMNANHGMFSLAYVVSAVLTGLAREAGWGPAAIFTVMSGLVVLLSLRMHTAVAEVSEEDRRASGLPSAVVLLCGGIVLLAFFVEAVVESWSALHIERTLGGRAAEGAFGPAVLGLTMAIGRFSGQAIAGRFQDITIITGGAVMAAIGGLLAAGASTSLMAYLGFGLMGLGVSVVGPMALALVGRLVPPAHRTTAVARANVIGFAAFLLSPLVMGQVSDAYGLRTAFVVVAGLALIAPLLAWMLKVRTGQAQSP